MTLKAESSLIPSALDPSSRLPLHCLLVGIVSLLAYLFLGLIHPVLFFHSFLPAFLFWLEISLGALAFLMIYQLTQGPWGKPIRPILMAGSDTLWIMSVFFIVLVIGLKTIFPWANPQTQLQEALPPHQAFYFIPDFFILRAFLYFLIWIGFRAIIVRKKKWSALGLILYCLTSTFAAEDWVMSLDTEWSSTLFGMIFFVGHALSAITFTLIIVNLLPEKIKNEISEITLNDLGNLFLVSVMLWAYLNFSQFLVIWSGNLPEEVRWYAQRSQGIWKVFAVFSTLFQFFIPFFALLFRKIKRNRSHLGIIAALSLGMRWIEIYWQVTPSFGETSPIQILDLFSFVGIGGIWLAFFFKRLKGAGE